MRSERLSPCTNPGCPTLVAGGGLCPDHAPPAWQHSTGTARTRTRAWRKLRLEILERDAWVCYLCGRPANTVDHVIAAAAGGTDDPSNLAACCAPCQKAKVPEDRAAAARAREARGAEGGG